MYRGDSFVLRLGFAAVCALVATVLRAQDQNSHRTSRQATEPLGFAVIELFTSQGCSSCPSADELLKKIARIAREKDLPVYVLSFHVDYWNRLGWTDPYSDASYSQRQRDYALASESRRVYTPQMIVGGTQDFVGSDESKAVAAITDMLSRKAQSKVHVRVEASDRQEQIAVSYSVEGSNRGDVLHLALVNSPAANSVPTGENAGRRLSHVNVVRSIKTAKLDRSTGRVLLEVPADVDLNAASILAFVQNSQSRRITGASSSGRIDLTLN